MPLSIEKQGEALKGISVETGINGGHPGMKPPYIAMCHLLYESIASFSNAFEPDAEMLIGDDKLY